MGSKDYRSKYGKQPKSERFIKIDHWVVRSLAWHELKPQQRCVYLLLMERYNGRNNGQISLSVREAAKLGRMAPATANKALARLMELGFIKRTFKGSFSQKIRDSSDRSYASEYAVTALAIGKASATKGFMRWRPEKSTVQNKEQGGIKLGAISSEHVI